MWLLETKGGVETWSNGLHVETRLTVENRPRDYFVWNRNNPNSSITQLPERIPAGIVFHTTESTMEELEEHRTRRLKLLGEALLQFARKEKAYSYMIDRFGRVFRIVRESDAANHAGKSIWADGKWAYINLNDSFLAISFESESRPGDEMPVISEAQINSGLFRRIEQSPKPVVAAVNGFALGGGFELALACHVRIASTLARFGLPEVKLGLIPGYGGTQRLPRVIGRGRALQLILTAEPIDAAEAHRIGVANAVVEPTALLEAARAMATLMLRNAPVALARAIAAVDSGLDATLDDGLRLEARLFGSLESTADMREGTRAFLEKRPPQFRGA